jgi:predicted lipoprotein with Yx(FWY)xxD motif
MVLTDDDGMPLYAFHGNAAAAAKLGSEWLPYRAPQAALALGKFRPLAGNDGVEQWTYDGRRLYRYRGDLQRGDSNGKAVDPDFHLITVRHYFMPDEVTIRADQRRGGVFVTAKEGRTLYARERTRQDRAGNHGARGGDRGDLGTGQQVGLIGCDAHCEQMRVPLIAPKNAQASGYWTVLKRDDGSLQWAYQGYALYSYLGEEPGQVTGYDAYDFIVNHDTKNLAPANKRMGFYWRVSSP